MTLSLSGYNKVVLSVGNGAKEAAASAVSASASAASAATSASNASASASAAAASAAEALGYTATAGGDLDAEIARALAAEALLAPKNSPTFTGTPTVPTAAAGTNTTQAASTAFVTAGLAPKAPLASPALTGIPTAPTAAIGTNSTQIATTEFATTLGNRVFAASSILLASVSGADTITASHYPAASGVTPAQSGQIYVMRKVGTNTTSAVTLAVGGGAALPVYDAHGAALSAGDLKAGDYIILACINGTSYRVISSLMTPAEIRAEVARLDASIAAEVTRAKAAEAAGDTVYIMSVTGLNAMTGSVHPDQSHIDVTGNTNLWWAQTTTTTASDPTLTIRGVTYTLKQRDGSVIPAGRLISGRRYHGVVTLTSPGIIRVMDVLTLEDLSQDTPSTLLRGLAAASKSFSPSKVTTGRIDQTHSGSVKWQVLQPKEKSSDIRVTTAGSKFDLSNLMSNTTVRFYCGAQTKFFAGHLRSFLNMPPHNMLTAEAGTVVIIHRIGPSTVADVYGGSVEYSTESAPIHEMSILLAGQSNAVLFYAQGGIGGFRDGARDSAWMTQGVLDLDPYWINGATGGTALLRASVGTSDTNYWYDDILGENGPALNNCLNQIDAAVAAGQPVPKIIFWSQGENDAGPMDVGTITPERLTTAIGVVWHRIRQHIVSLGGAEGDVRIIQYNVGSWENQLYRRGVSQVRLAYQSAIAATSWVVSGAELYDLPRFYGEIHYTEDGYWLLGRRMARAYANLYGTSYDLGPKVGLLTKGSDSKSLAINFSSSFTLSMPFGDILSKCTPASNPERVGGDAFGFGLIDSSGTPIRVKGGSVSGNTIIITTDSDITGARLCFPWGYFPESRVHEYVRDSQEDRVSSLPGLPLRSYVSDPL